MKRKNDFELKELVSVFKKMPAYRDKIYAEKIRKFWREEMGSSIAQAVQKIEIRRGKLYIRLESSVIRQELSYSKEQILKRMNDLIGEEYIKEVIF